MDLMLPQITAGTTLLEFYRQLITSTPLIDGKLVECEFEVADGTGKAFRHGLGRPWKGAIIVANSDTSIRATPGFPVPGTSSYQFGIGLSSAANILLRVWIFLSPLALVLLDG